MNTVHKVRWLLVAALCLAGLNSNAQNIFRFTFTGTASATNSAGKFVTQKVTEKTWLQDFLANNTITNNPRHLMVVYHVNGDSHGDTVDIVDTKSGATIYTIWGLFFSSDYGRLPMLSSDGLQQKRIDYVYGHISDHSIGSSLTTETVTLDRHGRTNRIRIDGQFDYLDLPHGTNKETRVCTGTFLATKPLKL